MTLTPREARKPSRRTILTTTAGAAGALTLTACGGDDGGGDGSGGGGGEQPLARLDEVPVGEAAGPFDAGDSQRVLFRADEKTVVAYDAACTHQGCSVEPDGTRFTCPCHQSVFDAATGEVLDGPAPEPLRSVTARVEGSRIVAE